MTATTLGPLLTEPVWYWALREPTWLLSRPREDALMILALDDFGELRVFREVNVTFTFVIY